MGGGKEMIEEEIEEGENSEEENQEGQEIKAEKEN